MLIEYINIILNSVGLPSVLTVTEISTIIQSATEWWHLLNPQLLFSIFAILGFCYSMFFVSCIMPFRLFKRLFKVDNKRGK